VDLTRTTFVDSTGLSTFCGRAAARTPSARRCTSWRPPGSEARVVIDLTGVGSLLGVDDRRRSDRRACGFRRSGLAAGTTRSCFGQRGQHLAPLRGPHDEVLDIRTPIPPGT
jgi:hypothetical protein